MSWKFRVAGVLAALLGFAAGAWAGTDAAVKIERADGTLLVKLKRSDDAVKIENNDGQLLLKGKEREAGGRKYKGPEGELVLKVADREDGFELKTEGGGLLWKIKHYDDRIKISSDEQNLNAAELRRKSADKWTVERADKPYGKVKRYPETGKIKVKDERDRELYRSDGGPFSAMYGVLLIPGIQPQAAYVIMAEIWLRGW